MKKRGALWADTMGYWIIAFIVLILMLFAYLIINGKLDAFTEFLKNLWRFGR